MTDELESAKEMKEKERRNQDQGKGAHKEWKQLNRIPSLTLSSNDPSGDKDSETII